MRVIHVDTYQEMAQTAALHIYNHIEASDETVLGLATGETPKGMYQCLVKLLTEHPLDLSRVTTFNLDEYVGIEPNNPNSYHAYMKHHFFQHIPINPSNIYIPKGNAKDLEEECARYEALIKGNGGIDLQVLGIGQNGHIGFNEPGTPFDQTTHIETLKPSTIKANSKYFKGDNIPQRAITMGLDTIMSAKEIILLASGEKKKEAIYKMIHGDITTDVPASILQNHPNVSVIVDRAAYTA